LLTAVAAVLVAANSVSAEESWMSGAWSSMASGSKKAWNTTVDVVTLKPVRRSFGKKPQHNEVRLGFKADPRKSKKPSPGLLGSWFGPKPQADPSTLEEFFAQERPR
jgi:hypothetical protein